VLRRIFGPNSDEVTGEWRRLHEEELNDMYEVLLTKYYSGDQIEKNKMDGACSAYEGEKRRLQGLGVETRGKETTWKTQA
jgi:hypothetical protein